MLRFGGAFDSGGGVLGMRSCGEVSTGGYNPA